MKRELAYPQSLGEHFESAKELLASIYPEYTSVSEEQLTLGSRAAIKHVYTTLSYVEEQETTFKEMQVYLVEGSRAWTITCSSSLDWWSHYEPIFDSIVSSFRLFDNWK